jgi:hypothetical protein
VSGNPLKSPWLQRPDRSYLRDNRRLSQRLLRPKGKR